MIASFGSSEYSKNPVTNPNQSFGQPFPRTVKTFLDPFSSCSIMAPTTGVGLL